MGTSADLDEVELLSGKTPWQEWVASTEVNTQNGGGAWGFFWSWKNKDDFIVDYFSSSPEIVA